MKKFLLIASLLATVLTAGDINGVYKVYISEPLLFTKDTISNPNVIKAKNKMEFTNCMIIKDKKEINIICLTNTRKNIYIKLEGYTLVKDMLVIKDPYLLGHEVNYNKIGSALSTTANIGM